MKFFSLSLVFLALACGGTALQSSALRPLPACAESTYFDGSRCVVTTEAREKIDAASVALEAFDVDAALDLLTAAASEGPHDHALLIRLYEQLAIAYAYLKDEPRALQAFERLLSLDPGHLLSYTLSPQATFLFEKARKSHQEQEQALVDLSWPQDLRESREVPLVVEVIADPKSLLRRMALHIRTDDAAGFERVDFPLGAPGDRLNIRLPAQHTDRPAILQIYGSAYDAGGNEVLLWFDANRPREIPLGYEAPPPWYRKWWVWAAVGGAVTVATGTTVYLLGLEPPDSVGGGFSFGR